MKSDGLTIDMFEADSSDLLDMPVGMLVEEVYRWAEETFPNRTDASMFLKMYKELGELVDEPSDSLEIADLFIMLMDYARRKNVNITTAVMVKLEINRRRTWIIKPDGTMSHVKQS